MTSSNPNSENSGSYMVENLPPYLPILPYHDRYQPFNHLGNGSFGSVLLTRFRGKNMDKLIKPDFRKIGTLMYPLDDCQANHTNLVAIKTMTKKLPILSDYSKVKELRFILTVSSHPCLVQIYEIFIDNIQFRLHIAMESMNQNLHQLMRARRHVHFSSVTLKSILSQILCGIRHIHKHNYFHRDVKPENILIIPTNQYYGSSENVPTHRKNDNYIVKIADYGLARHIHNLKPFTDYVSTRWYRSPEILLKNCWYSKPIDIWAFGVVCIEIVNFQPLFPGSNEVDQLDRILQVLGCPLYTEDKVAPLGGFWKDSEMLGARLGFEFPDQPGMKVEEIFCNPISNDLLTMIKGCLTWNPNIRATVEKCCDSSYFENTIITKEEQVYPNSFKASQPTLQMLSGITSPVSYNSMAVTANSNAALSRETRLSIYDDEIDDGYHYIHTSNYNYHDKPQYQFEYIRPGDELIKPEEEEAEADEEEEEEEEVEEEKSDEREKEVEEEKEGAPQVKQVDGVNDMGKYIWNTKSNIKEEMVPRNSKAQLTKLNYQDLSTYKNVFRYNLEN